MKRRIVILVMVASLLGCENEKETLRVDKEKYDNAINQIVTLENKWLQQEGELPVDEALLRENLGVVVYSEGRFIKLFYNVDGSKDWPRTERTYERISKNKYQPVDEQELKQDKNQKYFKTKSYKERVPSK